MRRVAIQTVLCVALALSATVAGVSADEPLPSWRESPARAAIVAFVEATTDADSQDFIPSAERVAVFDNDGTLWAENPAPFQLAFALDRLKRRLQSEPKLREDPFVQAAIDGDAAKLLADGHKGLLRVLALTHSGMTTEAFDTSVRDWLATAKHPRFNRPYDQCVYQPMLELLAYLHASGFKTYIVSGGGVDFMRVWSERVYGIPPEQVIGSRGGVAFSMNGGKPRLVKTMDSLFVDDKEGKPVAIHEQIGRRPVFVGGNSEGDRAMMRYTAIDNPRRSLALLIHHTDAEREYAYDAHPNSSGKLTETLVEANNRGWAVVDMKRDWSVVLPPPE